MDNYGQGLGLGDLLLAALSNGKMGKKFGKMDKFKKSPSYPSYTTSTTTSTTTAKPTTTTTTTKPCNLNLYLKTHIIPEYHKYK